MTDMCTSEKLIMLAEELCWDDGDKIQCPTMRYMR